MQRARGGRAARHPRRARRRDRRASSSTSGSSAVRARRARSSVARRSASIQREPFVALPLLERRSSRARSEVEFVRALDRGAARERRRAAARGSASLVRPHPERRRQWRDVDLDVRQRGRLARSGVAPDRRRGARGLLRLALPQRRGRRDQHHRDDRGGDRRQERADRPRPRVRRRRARCTSTTCWRRTAASSTLPRPRRARRAARAACSTRTRRRRAAPPLRRVVRPPARARPAGTPILGRRDRGARVRAGAPPARLGTRLLTLALSLEAGPTLHTAPTRACVAGCVSTPTCDSGPAARSTR